MSTTGRADGTSAVAQRALDNWWYSTYANFSDEYVKSATILESVRQSYLLTPEPGSPVMTSDMLGTRGLNIFLRKKQFEDANRCLEQKTGYVASTIVMNQTSNINAEIKCPMVHNQTPYTVKNGSSLISLALILTNLPLPHPHTPDHSSLPSLRLFRSCTFMVALRHSKLHQKKDYHKTLIDRRTLEKLMDHRTCNHYRYRTCNHTCNRVAPLPEEAKCRHCCCRADKWRAVQEEEGGGEEGGGGRRRTRTRRTRNGGRRTTLRKMILPIHTQRHSKRGF